MSKQLEPHVQEDDAAPGQRETSLLERAHAANAADHALTWLQAISKYRKAVFWACVFSFTLTMQACDATSLNTGSSYRQNYPKETLRTSDTAR
ncbi:hypothetical protein NKR23_g3804 [Pleurostoma richardsiae]|uniref:Uncharacterized protein n=1 Tax=Pleurostoma richardsiae TaxID=41990 RepID=A0AA38RIP4_9PEZI|nr:hypothetical protein NKR23_g3804 [Pleurostoma richardsiae]